MDLIPRGNLFECNKTAMYVEGDIVTRPRSHCRHGNTKISLYFS
jgi:hypothetical protein